MTPRRGGNIRSARFLAARRVAVGPCPTPAGRPGCSSARLPCNKGGSLRLEDAIPTRRPPGPARRNDRAALLALALTALLAGCAEPRDDDLYGMTLEVRTHQAWASDPALRRRVHDLVEASCEHVGLDPTMLWGMTLRIEDEGIDCGTVEDARGCTWRDAGVVAVSTLAWCTTEPPVPCVEDTPIPHELLHVRIGDPGHTDPRWRDPDYWRPLAARVSHPDCSGDPPILTW